MSNSKVNLSVESLNPKQIVAALDEYIVGQANAKKAVAIALRTRWRRRNIKDIELKAEVYPANIMMVGPTGVGKTEIARRLAKLANAPFIKVEATKFTEVGYVGRDVESIIRDLIEVSVNMVRSKLRSEVTVKATEEARSRILDALVGETSSDETKSKFSKLLDEGKMDDKEVDIQVADNASSGSPMLDIPGMPGGQMGIVNIGDMINKAIGGTKLKNKKMLVKDAMQVLITEESDKLLDEEMITKEAVNLVEQEGIVFIDEIDKIAARSDVKGEISREGVQRDLLPLIEGTAVSTKYGVVNTDHVLFISSGAFHLAKPSDLLPELQGRFPIRVELQPLTRSDMIKILTDPKASLIKQYKALMETEGIELEFTKDGIEKIAEVAAEINGKVENIGARRLHTMLEKLLEEVSYESADLKNNNVTINSLYVEERLGSLVKSMDLSRFIL